MLFRHPLYMALVATLSLIGFSPASSRVWLSSQASPDKLASDYATIHDSRDGGEAVDIVWFVPLMLRPTSERLAAALQKYVVIMAVHSQLNKTTGTAAFEDIDILQARDETGKPLTIVAKNDLPPETASQFATMESVFRGSGGVRKGAKMFVFDAGSVNSCKKGRLSVPFAGETYTWETPFPGC